MKGDALHPEMGEVDIAAVLRALADPVRLAIVLSLAKSDSEIECSRVYEPLGLGKSNASHHFRVLREAGLLVRSQHGRTQFASLRRRDFEDRFPGLLSAVVAGATAPHADGSSSTPLG